MSIAQVTVQKSAPWLRQQPTNIPGYWKKELTSAKSKFRKVYYIEDRDIPQITFEMVQFRLKWLKILEVGFEGTPKL